jgi:hypothetical protein
VWFRPSFCKARPASGHSCRDRIPPELAARKVLKGNRDVNRPFSGGLLTDRKWPAWVRCVFRTYQHFTGGAWHSENPKIPDFSDGWRPTEDEFCDVLGQERAGDIARNSFYELRRNLTDERVRIAFQAVLVTDSIFHMCMVRRRSDG